MWQIIKVCGGERGVCAVWWGEEGGVVREGGVVVIGLGIGQSCGCGLCGCGIGLSCMGSALDSHVGVALGMLTSS